MLYASEYVRYDVLMRIYVMCNSEKAISLTAVATLLVLAYLTRQPVGKFRSISHVFNAVLCRSARSAAERGGQNHR